MPLHTKVDGDGPEGQQLAVDPLFAYDGAAVPKHRMPDNPMDVATYASAATAELGPFELLTDGSELPVFAFKVRDDVSGFSAFDVFSGMRERGWQVPAYWFPENREDLVALRVVVRNGYSRDPADIFLDDLKRLMTRLEKQAAPVHDEAYTSFSHENRYRVEMLAETSNIDGPYRGERSLPGELDYFPEEGSTGLPVRRIGLEQEFFLVDRKGLPRDLADPFLRECREAAQKHGLDPLCFEAESVKGLVEITTPPSYGIEEMAWHYLANLGLAIEVASGLDLALYPLGTYPLPIVSALRDDPSYVVKASTIGYDRFSHAGRCAGAHLHLELPAGTVWPDVKAALDAPVAAQRELLDLYNLATALDPALVALSRACPFYQGKADGFAARTVHYRGILGFEGLYSELREVGGLSAYASRVEDLVDQQRARYRAWFAAMDHAGVERRLFAQTGGNLYRASWNPVRLSRHGTVEIRSMDANFPEKVLAVCALIRGAAERVRRERLEVRPCRGVLTLEPDGDLLFVPVFTHLNGELLAAAATRGVWDRRIEAYVDSIMRFASPYLERPELVERLGSSGGYRTTESEILEAFPAHTASLTRERGLLLVREACRRLKEQASSLRRRYAATTPGDAPGVARVIDIRGSLPIPVEEAQPASVHDAQASAANEESA